MPLIKEKKENTLIANIWRKFISCQKTSINVHVSVPIAHVFVSVMLRYASMTTCLSKPNGPRIAYEPCKNILSVSIVMQFSQYLS